MDNRYTRRPLARWYMVAAIASLLFMLVACGGFVADILTDPRTLPLDQRVVMQARPEWAMVAYGIAVIAGLLGAILLVARRKAAQPLLLVSLVAAVVTFLPLAVTPAVRDNVTSNDVAVAIVVVAITWTIFWFARHSAQRGWLR